MATAVKKAVKKNGTKTNPEARSIGKPNGVSMKLYPDNTVMYGRKKFAHITELYGAMTSKGEIRQVRKALHSSGEVFLASIPVGE